MGGVTASVVINNYNYGRFLADAIDSALAQTYARTEVVVVDDGSTDDSRAVIARYRGRVVPVLQDNRGQAAALNAGFAACQGEVVCFLDADDLLLPTAVERACAALDREAVKVHWPLYAVDERGRRTGGTVPERALPEGDLREEVVRDGPLSSGTPPTSGNAWSRRFLERVLPVPEQEYRICADAYLCSLAPACGPVRRLPGPEALYRIHGQNNYWGKDFAERLRLGLAAHEQQCLALHRFFQSTGVAVDPGVWRRNSWYHRLRAAVEEIAAVVHAGEPFILVDEEQWGTDALVAGRPRVPFLEREGQYWGRPPDDTTAVAELDRLRRAGAGCVVFGWPAFWWLDHYAGLHRHLRATYRCALENERLIAFRPRA